MARLLAFGLLGLVFSCTILEDSDITSADQFSGFTLKSFEIVQNTLVGNSTTVVTLLYDSAYNDIIDDLTGAKIVRIQRFSMPALGNRLKLRSGVTTNVEFTISYAEYNKPYTMAIFKGDLFVERYRFRYSNYSSSGKLNKIITAIAPNGIYPEGSNFTIHANDTLIFDNTGKLTTIERRSFLAGQAGTFSIAYLNDEMNFSFGGTSYGTSSGPTNQCDESACQTVIGIGGVGGYGVGIGYNSSEESSALNFSVLYWGCCGYEPGTYYLHPLFFLRDQFEKGGQLMIIYMKDWWIPGASNSIGQDNRSESVSFLPKYGI